MKQQRTPKIEPFTDKKKFMEEIVKLKKEKWHLASLVPWLKDEGKELIILYVFSVPGKERILSIELDPKHPHMESIIEPYPLVNSFELEGKELFGIWFDGNPNMNKRFFLPEDFEGVPFRQKKCDEKKAAAEFFKKGEKNA